MSLAKKIEDNLIKDLSGSCAWHPILAVMSIMHEKSVPHVPDEYCEVFCCDQQYKNIGVEKGWSVCEYEPLPAMTDFKADLMCTYLLFIFYVRLLI